MTLTTALEEIKQRLKDGPREADYQCAYMLDVGQACTDISKLLRVVELQSEALEKGCYRHSLDCDAECTSDCPVQIKKRALVKALNILEGKE